MIFETGLAFGKNAAMINEAYAKMYAKKVRRINERAGDDEDEFTGDLSDKQKEYIQNFDAEKEYQEYRRAMEEQRRKEREENNDEVADGDSDQYDNSGSEEGEDEDTKNFMSSYNSHDDSDSQDDDDFVFSPHYNVSRSKYPDWLRAAAKKAGYKLDERNPEEDTVQPKSEPKSSSVSVAAKSSDDDFEEMTDEEKAENFYQNVIVSNPDVFNEERYDMDAISAHKKELCEKGMEYMLKAYREVEAAEKALEEIPGCECKEQPQQYDDEDFVGDIDSDDSADDYVKSIISDSGFGVVVKNYERVYSTDGKPKFQVRYITPNELKGVNFETEEEAITALRNALKPYVGDVSDVCIGVVIDNSVNQKLFASKDGMEDVVDDNGNPVLYTSGPRKGKPKRQKIQSKVYTISTSDEENTSRCLSYESNNWTTQHICDEYLQ